MLIFAYYILKVIICSGILYGYYLVALRNKIFHRWNRFYLLAIVIISLAAPLIKINIWQTGPDPSTQAIQIFQVVSAGDSFVYEYSKNTKGFHVNASNLSVFLYSIISALLLAFLIQTLIRINKLKRAYQSTVIGEINFINTDARGTPFSFFNNIFWNKNIDINTSTGKQIFQHEVAHVQEKHSYDKIFMNVVLIIFWCNPVFWLIRKELNMIHEFIADRIAVEDNDVADFAAMILLATYPQQQFNITNNFFYSPLKRRLTMLTKTNHPTTSYISRLLVLPLAALIFFAFTLKMKTARPSSLYTGKKITVVIDAGHGGDDKGLSVDNIHEKDLTLSIAKQVKELNKNENIHIILSRAEDKYIHPSERVKFSQANKADLFISIHMDAANNNTTNGLNILIPNNDNPYIKESRILGSSLIETFKENYQLNVGNDLMQRAKSVWILKANQTPAVLIEAGILENPQELEYLRTSKSHETIAKNILIGIENYAIQISKFTPAQVTLNKANEFIQVTNKKQLSSSTDSIPQFYNGKKIKKAQSSEKLNKTVITYEDGSMDSIPITEAEKIKLVPPPPPRIIRNDDKVFTKVEVEPTFPGGNEAWIRYVKKIIERNISDLTMDNKSGTCRVRFIVDTEGSVSQVVALTMKGTKLAEIAVEAIKIGPRWNPATQNGHVVAAYREQPITFTIREDNKVRDEDKVFTKAQVPPSFPGGDEAWGRYAKKVIEKRIEELVTDNKSGTCRVRFIVDTEGNVSNVEAVTMKGTKLAEIAVEAIKKGPKWVAAMQNDRKVTAYREQPITFTIAPN